MSLLSCEASTSYSLARSATIACDELPEAAADSVEHAPYDVVRNLVVHELGRGHSRVCFNRQLFARDADVRVIRCPTRG